MVNGLRLEKASVNLSRKICTVGKMLTIRYRTDERLIWMRRYGFVKGRRAAVCNMVSSVCAKLLLAGGARSNHLINDRA